MSPALESVLCTIGGIVGNSGPTCFIARCYTGEDPRILEEQERQKKEIKEQEEKRLKELREQAKEKEQKTIMTKPFDQKKGDVHVDTDYITVRPLFEEQKGMQKLNKRSTDLDAIDYSKL